LKNNEIRELPKAEVAAILDFLLSKKEDIEHGSFNKVIRDDIFRLLEKQCIVVYFPKKDEDNNGFNVKYYMRGKLMHFVYINTAQHKEKQIFTAAHELGHIWDLMGWMKGNCFTGDEEWNEWVINRFAAELLMPMDEFKEFTQKAITNIRGRNEGYSVTVGIMVHIITAIMNEFFTPYKSVVYRLYELGFIGKKSVAVLLSNYDAIEKLSSTIAQEQGYSRLYRSPDNLKWIVDLKNLLDQAKSQEALPEKWIESFYRLFDFDETRQSDTFEISLTEDVNIGGEADA